MTNIEKLVSHTKLSHSEFSSQTGRKGNWFNDAFNNNEDIKISTLAKILSVINNQNEIKHYQLSDLFDAKVLRITNVMISIADENLNTIKNFIISENDLFIDIIGDLGLLDSNNKLLDDEHVCLKKLKELIADIDNKEA